LYFADAEFVRDARHDHRFAGARQARKRNLARSLAVHLERGFKSGLERRMFQNWFEQGSHQWHDGGMTAFGGWSLERVEKSKVEKSKAKPRWNLESAILNLQSSICYLLSTISPRSPRFHRTLDQRGSGEAWNHVD